MNPFQFAGQYTEGVTGLIYMRARWYDPATGQFLSRDPIEQVTRQAYSYADGNPINRVDPTGMSAVDALAVRKLSSAIDAVATATGALMAFGGAFHGATLASGAALIAGASNLGAACGSDLHSVGCVGASAAFLSGGVAMAFTVALEGQMDAISSVGALGYFGFLYLAVVDIYITKLMVATADLIEVLQDSTHESHREVSLTC